MPTIEMEAFDIVARYNSSTITSEFKSKYFFLFLPPAFLTFLLLRLCLMDLKGSLLLKIVILWQRKII